MKRSGPLPRRTPLAQGKPLTRTVGANVPRPRKTQTAEERNARAVVYARSGGRCELCGRPAESWSHRRAAGQGGKWAPSNGLHLCGDGVRGCHGWLEAHPIDADLMGWRIVHRDPDPALTPVRLPEFGWCLLDDNGGITPVTTDQIPPHKEST